MICKKLIIREGVLYLFSIKGKATMDLNVVCKGQSGGTIDVIIYNL